MPEAKSWFVPQNKKPEKKKKKKRPPVSAAEIKRLLDLENDLRERYPINRLSMGSVIELEKPEVFNSKLREFWLCPQEEACYSSEYYFTLGTYSGEEIQKRLHKIGVTFCDSEEFEEYKIVDKELGLAGKVDLILKLNAVKALGSVKRKEYEEEENPSLLVAEIKQTGSRNYSLWHTYEELPLKYRVQLSLYLYYLKKRGIIDSNNGIFILQNRDNPRDIRVIPYEKEQELVDRAKKVCDSFWTHIRNRTFPEGCEPVSIEKIEEAIEIGCVTGRRWSFASGIPSLLKEKILSKEDCTKDADCPFPEKVDLTISGPGPDSGCRNFQFPKVSIPHDSVEYTIQKDVPGETECDQGDDCCKKQSKPVQGCCPNNSCEKGN
jgi:hypothetical protein